MHIVVTADENWGIGYRGNRLVSIPADLKTLQKMITGKTIVLGSGALQNMPVVLLDRVKKIYILSHDKSAENLAASLGAGSGISKRISVFRNLEALLSSLSEHRSEDIYVLGGEQTYAQLLPYADTVHVTKIEHAYTADAWFPNLDKQEEWQIVADSDEQTCFDLEYYFYMYQRVR